MFTDADRNKKNARIELPENPSNLSKEVLSQLEDNVKASLREGYLPCPVAWSIAKDLDVPRIAVGKITDKLGIRITDCQLGCFQVDKTPYSSSSTTQNAVKSEITLMLEKLGENKQLTCEKAFELAKKVKLKPMVIGTEASAKSIKIRQCQLGCF